MANIINIWDEDQQKYVGVPVISGKTPARGTDYWTDTDKAEIVQEVMAALPAWTGGSY